MALTLSQLVALPAVVLPDFLNDVRSLDRASIVVPGLQVQQHSFITYMMTMSARTIQNGHVNTTIARALTPKRRKQITSQ